MSDQATWRRLLGEALAASDEAPLSVRRAMLVVMLADALVAQAVADRLASGAGDDPLVERAALGAESPGLALALELAAHRASGPRLAVESVEVPLTDYGCLPTADFMVSLYNENTVQRLLVAFPDGSRQDAHEVLHEAARALGATEVGAQPT